MKNSKENKPFQPIENSCPSQKNNNTQEIEMSPIEVMPQKRKKWLWIVIYLILFAAGAIGVAAFKMWFSK